MKITRERRAKTHLMRKQIRRALALLVLAPLAQADLSGWQADYDAIYGGSRVYQGMMQELWREPAYGDALPPPRILDCQANWCQDQYGTNYPRNENSLQRLERLRQDWRY